MDNQWFRRSDAAQIGRGFLMGGADIIPGVSGGTIALILGIYERLVAAVSRFDRTLLRFLADRRWAAAAEYIDLRFVVTLGCGIALGIVSLASLMHHLLENHRSFTLSAFFGLILASSLIVARTIRAADGIQAAVRVGVGVLGALVALWIVTRSGFRAQPGHLYTFGCGMVAICAMILPGISGSYILLLLGKYEQITGIIKSLPRGEVAAADLVTLAVFAAGCTVGILGFSKLLRWLLARYHDVTMSLLCGFMIGSLAKIWPFQIDTTPERMEHKEYVNYVPDSWDATVLGCAAIGVAALVVVLTLARLAGSRGAGS